MNLGQILFRSTPSLYDTAAIKTVADWNATVALRYTALGDILYFANKQNTKPPIQWLNGCVRVAYGTFDYYSGYTPLSPSLFIIPDKDYLKFKKKFQMTQMSISAMVKSITDIPKSTIDMYMSFKTYSSIGTTINQQIVNPYEKTSMDFLKDSLSTAISIIDCFEKMATIPSIADSVIDTVNSIAAAFKMCIAMPIQQCSADVQSTGYSLDTISSSTHRRVPCTLYNPDTELFRLAGNTILFNVHRSKINLVDFVYSSNAFLSKEEQVKRLPYLIWALYSIYEEEN